MRALLVTLALSASMVAHASILVMGYDREAKAFVALTDVECSTSGKVATIRTKEAEIYIGCWKGVGNEIEIYLPSIDETVVYKAGMFHMLTPDFKIADGGITATI